MSDGAAGGPVFVLTTHRSGGTLLARVLNCHPDLLVWGEHAGFINRLAEIDAILDHYPQLAHARPADGIAAFVTQRKADPGHFDPWTTPFSRDAFRAWCHGYLEVTFRQGLRPGQRWGFKEIRYHTPTTARFLAALFPQGRFVILKRALYPLTLSNLFAPWSIDRLRWSGALRTEDTVRAAVDDCAYALTAIDHGLDTIAAALADRCFVVAHEAINAGAVRLFAELFMFLGLSGSSELLTAVTAVVGSRVGASDLMAGEGCLTLPIVERLLPDALAAAQVQIATHGPDAARLKRLGTQGRYSFLTGDHNLYETPLSAMF